MIRNTMKSSFKIVLVLLPAMILLVGMACNLSLPVNLPGQPSPQPGEPTPTPGPTPQPSTEIEFTVEIPANTPADQPVYLVLVDEVTGLALNSQRYEMKSTGEQKYTYTLRFQMGSLVKYRYSRNANGVMLEEHISDGRQLRYRMYNVEGPGEVHDVVTRWTDTTTDVVTGRISGHALDAFSGQPLPNLLVAAGGSQTLTASDGSFLLEGLPPGTHNLVGVSLDGGYLTFQQGAVVAADSTTPAELRLTQAALVRVNFVVNAPEGTIPAVPIRLAGNIYQLGNTFGDLTGGVNGLASRMPVLSLTANGMYSLTLMLPAGADLRYTYTLGDGFWNSELSESGARNIRQLIVPDQDTTVEENIAMWSTGEVKSITFDLIVPTNTLPGDTVSIQFNPIFGWTEPIPMWRLADNRWAYVLNGPLQTIDSMHYRYCRNDQCGSADDGQTAGPDHPGLPVRSGNERTTLRDTMINWAWLAPQPVAVVDPVAIQPRGTDFTAGIEFLPAYHPSWLPQSGRIIESIRSMNSGWVFLTPTWTFTRTNLPILEQVPGKDPLWMDLETMTSSARAGGLNVAIAPTPRFNGTAARWWQDSKRDFSWWVVWFERYRTFAIHHADLAARTGAQALVLGGDWIGPALPGGTLPDGTPSGVPADAETRWRTLIEEIRSRYPGKLVWAITLEQASANPPAFLDMVDQVYVTFNPVLSQSTEPTRLEMETEAARILDTSLLPFQARFAKPLVLGISYPSADGAATGCLPSMTEGLCLDPNNLTRPNPDVPVVLADLGEQADIYSAVLAAVNQRTWISGVVSRGYYPPAALQDKSPSINGKPAQAILQYWFASLLAPIQ